MPNFPSTFDLQDEIENPFNEFSLGLLTALPTTEPVSYATLSEPVDAVYSLQKVDIIIDESDDDLGNYFLTTDAVYGGDTWSGNETIVGMFLVAHYDDMGTQLLAYAELDQPVIVGKDYAQKIFAFEGAVTPMLDPSQENLPV